MFIANRGNKVMPFVRNQRVHGFPCQRFLEPAWVPFRWLGHLRSWQCGWQRKWLSLMVVQMNRDGGGKKCDDHWRQLLWWWWMVCIRGKDAQREWFYAREVVAMATFFFAILLYLFICYCVEFEGFGLWYDLGFDFCLAWYSGLLFGLNFSASCILAWFGWLWMIIFLLVTQGMARSTRGGRDMPSTSCLYLEIYPIRSRGPIPHFPWGFKSSWISVSLCKKDLKNSKKRKIIHKKTLSLNKVFINIHNSL